MAHSIDGMTAQSGVDQEADCIDIGSFGLSLS